MPQLRLMGLALVITTIFLALAAATTQTTHIRIKRPSRASAETSADPGATDGMGADGGNAANPFPDDAFSNGVLPPTTSDETASSPQFFMVPIAIPLAVAGIVGLVLWFGPAPRYSSTTARRRRRRR